MGKTRLLQSSKENQGHSIDESHQGDKGHYTKFSQTKWDFAKLGRMRSSLRDVRVFPRKHERTWSKKCVEWKTGAWVMLGKEREQGRSTDSDTKVDNVGEEPWDWVSQLREDATMPGSVTRPRQVQRLHSFSVFVTEYLRPGNLQRIKGWWSSFLSRALIKYPDKKAT